MGAHRWRVAGRARCRSGRRWACGAPGSRRPWSGASPPAARRAARAVGTGTGAPPPPRPAGAPARGGGARGRTTWADLLRDRPAGRRSRRNPNPRASPRKSPSRGRRARVRCREADLEKARTAEMRNRIRGSGVGVGWEKMRGGRMY
jgi:hypothetical protein